VPLLYVIQWLNALLLPMLQVDEHYLLAEPSSEGGAARSVMVSVETPMLVVESDRDMEQGSDAHVQPLGDASSVSGRAAGWLWGLLGRAAWTRHKRKLPRDCEDEGCGANQQNSAELGGDGAATAWCSGGKSRGFNGVMCSSAGGCRHSSRHERSSSLGEEQQHRPHSPHAGLLGLSSSNRSSRSSSTEQLDQLVSNGGSGGSGGGALHRRGSRGELHRLGKQ